MLFFTSFRLEFGRCAGDGAVVELASESLAILFASSLVRVLSTHYDKGQAAMIGYWSLTKSTPRALWANKEFFVALTLKDRCDDLPSVRSQIKGEK
jgi:hypothetical protein